MRRRPRLAAALAAVAVVAAACASPSADERAAIDEARGSGGVESFSDDERVFTLPEPDDVELDPGVGVIEREGERPVPARTGCAFDRPELDDAWCGNVVMPGRGEDPDYEVTIAFAHIPSTADEADVQPDPVVFLHGGPGGSIVADLDFWYDTIVAPHIDTRDVIVYDQRGGGRSTTLPICREARESSERFHSTPTPHEELAGEFLDDLAECAGRVEDSGVDLTAYNSRINAEDLLDLLWALGVQQYNIHGSSYGTRLAQTVLRDAPEGVRSVILSGAYPIEVNLMGSVSVSFESALTAVFEGCAVDDDCAAALPDPWGSLEALVAELDAAPLTVDTPIWIDEVDETRFDGTDLLNGLHSLLYIGTDAAQVPDLLIDHADGDLRRLERLAANSVFDYTDTVTFLLVQCADEGAFTTADDLVQPLEHEFLRAVELAPSINGLDSLTICDAWDTGTTPPIENEPVTWDVPTLILSGAADPITPPNWASDLAARLPRARLVHQADMSHDSSDSWCALDLMTAFVEQPDLLLDASCAAAPTSLPMPNLAERLRPSTGLVDGSVDLDDDGEFIDIRVPDWWVDWNDDAIVRWRDLDVFDLTSIVIRGPGSAYDVRDHLPFERTPVDFAAAPTTATPDGWTRSLIETSAGDLIRYTNDRTGVDVTLHIEPGETANLELDYLVPLAVSIGDDQ